MSAKSNRFNSTRSSEYSGNDTDDPINEDIALLFYDAQQSPIFKNQYRDEAINALNTQAGSSSHQLPPNDYTNQAGNNYIEQQNPNPQKYNQLLQHQQQKEQQQQLDKQYSEAQYQQSYQQPDRNQTSSPDAQWTPKNDQYDNSQRGGPNNTFVNAEPNERSTISKNSTHTTGQLNLNSVTTSQLCGDQYSPIHFMNAQRKLKRPPRAANSGYKTNKIKADDHINSLRRINVGNLLGTTDNRYGNVDSTSSMLNSLEKQNRVMKDDNNRDIRQLNVTERDQEAQSDNNRDVGQPNSTEKNLTAQSNKNNDTITQSDNLETNSKSSSVYEQPNNYNTIYENGKGDE